MKSVFLLMSCVLAMVTSFCYQEKGRWICGLHFHPSLINRPLDDERHGHSWRPRESDNWESDRWESDSRASDRWESDSWESDSWESDSRVSDRWEPDSWESDSRVSDRWEPDSWESDSRESDSWESDNWESDSRVSDRWESDSWEEPDGRCYGGFTVDREEPSDREGWTSVHYVYLIHNPKSYTDARRYCQQEGGGNLVKIAGRRDEREIISLIKKCGHHEADYWIGLKKSWNNRYRWDLDHSVLRRTFWWRYANRYHDCVAMVYEGNYKWSGRNCNERMSFICEKP